MRVLDSIDEQALDALTAAREFVWLDVADASDEQVRALGERFGWHPLAQRASVAFGQRPKLDHFGEHLLIVFYGARHAEEGTHLVEVHLLVSASWVVTLRRSPCPELDELRVRMQAETPPSEQFVVYRILDVLTDTFFPALDAIDDEIDELEDAIVVQPDDRLLQRIFHLKRDLVALRRVVTPMRDLTARALEDIGELPGLAVDARDWYREVYDRLIRVSDTVDSYRDLLTSAMDVYLSTVSNRLNDVMKKLTLVATIFLPITALTGFFGQNFGWLVRHTAPGWTFFVFGIGGAVAAIGGLMWWFKRARFLD